jgi:hypothetical protein
VPKARIIATGLDPGYFGTNEPAHAGDRVTN